MTRSLLLLVGLTVCVSAAQAQGAESFYPLYDGDTWTYERVYDDTYYVAAVDRFVGYRRVSIVGDTTIDAEAFKLAHVEYLRFSQAVDSTARCVVRLAGDDARVEWRSILGTCGAFEANAPLGTATTTTGTYYANGTPYTGPTRTPDSATIVAAEGVGAVETRMYGYPPPPANKQRLLTAVVGGQTYGSALETTAWRAFLPLGVGDRWLYQTVERNASSGVITTAHVSWAVVGDSAVAGTSYRRVVVTNYNAAGVQTGRRTEAWRHQDATGCLVRREPAGTETCLTDTRFTQGLGRVQSLARTGPVTVSGQTYTTRVISDAWYGTLNAAGSVQLAAGIGLVGSYARSGGSSGGSSWSNDLLYARVGGTEYGAQPAWATWSTASEDAGPSGASAALSLRVLGPNPTRGTVGLAVVSETASRVSLSVFDALGRRVVDRQETVGAGEQTLTLDLSRQAPGVYVVRLTSPDAAPATAPVTVY